MASFTIRSSGHVVLVDEQDLWLAERFCWRVQPYGRRAKKFRVYTVIGGRKRRTRIFLSRLLMGEPICRVDHRNGDTLDNRKSVNLRRSTQLENSRNRAKSSHRGSSQYKGVWLHKTRHGKPVAKNPWRAGIRVSGRRINLGWFRDEAAAARAYDSAAAEYFGEFARPNFPLDGRP